MNGEQKKDTSPPRHRGNSPMVIPSASPTSDSRHRERSAKEAAAPLSPNYASEAETEILGLTPEKKRQRPKEDEAKREGDGFKKRNLDGQIKKEATVRYSAEKSSTTRSGSGANSIPGGNPMSISEDVNKTTSVPSSPTRRQKTPQLDRSISADESVISPAKISDQNSDGSKKRKHGYERNSSGEPPRQKHKSDPVRTEGPSSDLRRPSLPTTLKINKRASSVRSSSQERQIQMDPASLQGQARKGREGSTNTSMDHTGDAWNSDSSDQSLHHAKAFTKQSSARSQISPVRIMPQIKKRVDRFGVSIFARYCEKGDLEAAKQALEQSPDDIDEPDYAKNTPLQKASLEGHVNVVKFLISTGRCNINNANTSQDTPLIDAVENGHLEVVKILLANGADPHLQNKAGSNPYDVIDDEDEHSEEIMTALREAMQKDSIQRKSDGGIELGSARSESQQNSPALPKDPATGFVGSGRHTKLPNSILHMESTVENLRNKTAEGDQVAVYELLIRRVKPDNACGVAAARGGHEFILNLFIDKGLDMDPDPMKYDYETPMLVAIGRGHLSIVDLLLKQDGFDPTRRARRGQAYYELAEERRGPNWQKERDMLKETFDHYVQRRDKAITKQKNSSPRSSEKDKTRKSPHRDKSLNKEKMQRPTLTHSRTSSGNYTASATESGTIKSEPNEASHKVSDVVLKKIKRRGSEPGSLTDPAERRRKLVQAKDLQRLDRDQRKLNGNRDLGGDERQVVHARASESPKLSEHAPLSQKQKLKAKGRRLSNHDRDKQSSGAMSHPASGTLDPQKAKAYSHGASTSKGAIDRSISSETKIKSSEKHVLLGKNRGDEREKPQSKKEALQENKGQRKDERPVERKHKSSEERPQEKQALSPKNSVEGTRSERKRFEKPSSEKHLPGKGLTEKKRNDREAIEKDGKYKNDSETKSIQGGSVATNSTKFSDAEDRDNEENSKGKPSTKVKVSVKDDEMGGTEKERLEKDFSHESYSTKDNRDKQRLEKKLKEELADSSENNRIEKERLEKENVEKQRRERERLEQERIAKEGLQKERLRKEQTERERQEKERAEKERLESERLEKEKIEKQRLENERRERERIEKERLEKERIEKERLEKEQQEKKRQEKERLEKERLEKERLEKERAENDRIEKERQEEEKREKARLEAERLQKLEEERRALERQQYLATLPPSLRQALILGPRLPIRTQDGRLSLLGNFLPLYVVRLVEIDPSCQDEERQDPWILNFQAAVILGHHDMNLTQHPSWRRYPMTHDHRRFFLQGYDIADLALLQRHPPHSALPHDPSTLIQAVEEAKTVFLQMQPLFWISLADFLKVIPQYPRLKDVKMRTLAICHVDYVDDPEFGLSRRDVLEFKRDNSRLDVIRRVSSQNLKSTIYINGMPEQVNGSL